MPDALSSAIVSREVARTRSAAATRPTCAGYLGHLFRKWAIENNDPRVLVSKHEMSIQAESRPCFSALLTHCFWERRSSFSVSFSSAHQATDLLLFSSPAPPLSAIDTPASYLTATGNDHGSCPWKSRPGGRECPLAQHLSILRRQTKRPTYTKSDRILVVLLARGVRTWKQALVQPETLLKWHRQGCAPLLEAEVKAEVDTHEGGSRNHRAYQEEGEEQSASSERNVFGAND